ncbi:uncharacterized protein LOC143912529 [Arctopsyche grandis]|uniref:uncharacterized protein LOC143912529 n=1 Tax=Arctopsyche grandis TaxID=121162 RepID=UPI00406D8E8B
MPKPNLERLTDGRCKRGKTKAKAVRGQPTAMRAFGSDTDLKSLVADPNSDIPVSCQVVGVRVTFAMSRRADSPADEEMALGGLVGGGGGGGGGGRALSELAAQLEEYAPTVPEPVVAHYLAAAGFEPHDPRLLRLIAIAAQKFLADVANDALQHCKTRSSSSASSSSSHNKPHKPPKEKRYTMTMEDLVPALHDYGINAKKPHYFV